MPTPSTTRSSLRRSCDITGEARVSAVLPGRSGISGTDASFASHASSRPDEFVYNEVPARPLQLAPPFGARRATTRRAARSPLPSRHARRHLTTLPLSRCVEPGSTTLAAGVNPVRTRARRTQTANNSNKFGCYGRDPRDSGRKVWQGGACVR